MYRLYQSGIGPDQYLPMAYITVFCIVPLTKKNQYKQVLTPSTV